MAQPVFIQESMQNPQEEAFLLQKSNFIKKVYGLVFIEFCILNLLAWAVHASRVFQEFIHNNIAVFIVALAIVLIIFVLVVFFRQYVETQPANIFIYFFFSLGFSFLLIYIQTTTVGEMMFLMFFNWNLILTLLLIVSLIKKKLVNFPMATALIISAVILGGVIFSLATKYQFVSIFSSCCISSVWGFYFFFVSVYGFNTFELDYNSKQWILYSVGVHFDVIFFLFHVIYFLGRKGAKKLVGKPSPQETA